LEKTGDLSQMELKQIKRAKSEKHINLGKTEYESPLESNSKSKIKLPPL